jgi:hypothetical protein
MLRLIVGSLNGSIAALLINRHFTHCRVNERYGLGSPIDLRLVRKFIGRAFVARPTIRGHASGKFEIVQTVTTPVGAKTMDVDPETHRVYLPTAEFEEQKPGATGRPAAKPGTFMIVVVGHH